MMFTHMLNKIFSYINDNLLDEENSKKIPEQCMVIFKIEIIQKLNKKLISAVFDAINRDRDYEIIDRNLVVGVLNTFKVVMTLRKPKTWINPSDK